MTSNVILMENRQLIPRWHTSRLSMRLQFPTLTKGAVSEVDEGDHGFWLEEKRNEWRLNPTIQTATELNSFLFLSSKFKDPDYNLTLSYLLSRFEELPKGAARVVSANDEVPNEHESYSTKSADIHRMIHMLRRSVRRQPQNCLAWMDLGFYYAVLGEDLKASNCLRTAWHQCEGHPLMSRSYARYLVHMGEPEEAIWILRKSGNFKVNPLVASAIIAIARSFELHGMKIADGRKILKSYTGDPTFTSDLSACLGTIDFESGNIKSAKKLFNKSLISPSENAVSQYGWLSQKFGFSIGDHLQVPVSSIESDVNNLYVKGDFKKCRAKLLQLHNFQPFSNGPLADAGYMSLLGLNDPNFVISLSGDRIPKTHMGFGELNNLVVANIMVNDLSGIEADMRLLDRKSNQVSGSARGVFLATSGMLMFKLGCAQKGINLYESAISYFKQTNSEKAQALAAHFYSQNIKDIDHSKYVKLRQIVSSLAKKYKMKELL